MTHPPDAEEWRWWLQGCSSMTRVRVWVGNSTITFECRSKTEAADLLNVLADVA